MKKKDISKECTAVRNWFLSFVPLCLSAILFILCFIFETVLWLYFLCTVSFCSFVLLFIRADRAITHPDGYTYIQAIFFYKGYAQLKQDSIPNTSVLGKTLFAYAKEYEYARNLSPKSIICLYQTGKDLVERFEKRKWHHV